MLNLIANENMKIYRRVRTWLLVAILIAFSILVLVIDQYGRSHNTPEGADWKANLQQEVVRDKHDLDQLKQNMPQPTGEQEKMIKRQEDAVQLKEYRIAHDIPPTDNMWTGMLDATGLMALITIFTVIIAADIVAGEFAGGTIKLLLIRPASRSKILLSKYAATLLFVVFMLLVLFVCSFIMSGILWGFGDVGLPHLNIKEGVIHEVNMFAHVLGKYGLGSIQLVMVVTLAFMISSAFRSSLLAMGLSFLVLFFSGVVVNLMVNLKYNWIKYYLFANTDLNQYIEGDPLLSGMTMQFSIAVLLAYFVIFMTAAWTIFTKRDVAA